MAKIQVAAKNNSGAIAGTAVYDAIAENVRIDDESYPTVQFRAQDDGESFVEIVVTTASIVSPDDLAELYSAVDNVEGWELIALVLEK